MWQLLDANVVITDLDAFSAFTAANGYPIHQNGGEINHALGTMYLGVTSRGGARQTILDQYIAFKYPGTQYCETYARPRPHFCPPQGGVLFIQPASQYPAPPVPPGEGYLRSEADVNCAPPASPACPSVPGACWANEFSDATVGEIWIR